MIKEEGSVTETQTDSITYLPFLSHYLLIPLPLCAAEGRITFVDNWNWSCMQHVLSYSPFF
jgi:hypothetical protein